MMIENTDVRHSQWFTISHLNLGLTIRALEMSQRHAQLADLQNLPDTILKRLEGEQEAGKQTQTKEEIGR